MAKIIDFFTTKDKLQHIALSICLLFWFTALSSLVFNYWTSVVLGSAITLVCGFGKEIYDTTRDDKVASWNDIIADLIGWMIALIPLILLGI